MSSPEQEPSASMELGRTGVRVSRLGLGAMVWGDMASAPRFNPARNVYGPTSSDEDQQEALDVSLAGGVSLVDTAAMYGKGASERRVGELTEGRDVLVATKFPAGFLARQNSLPETLAASLNRLRRPVVDLYQIHYPSQWMSIPKLMAMMADAVGAGKVRTVGVSNYSAAQMRTAHAALAKIQTVNELFREIGERYDTSASQVALRWLIQRDVLPIPGAKNARQAAQNAGALSFTLTQSDMDALTDATAWAR